MQRRLANPDNSVRPGHWKNYYWEVGQWPMISMGSFQLLIAQCAHRAESLNRRTGIGLGRQWIFSSENHRIIGELYPHLGFDSRRHLPSIADVEAGFILGEVASSIVHEDSQFAYESYCICKKKDVFFLARTIEVNGAIN